MHFRLIHSRISLRSFSSFLVLILIAIPSSVDAASSAAQNDKGFAGCSIRTNEKFSELSRANLVSGTLDGLQVARYRIRLRIGEFVYLALTQHGIDISVHLLTPNCREIANFDSPWFVAGFKPLFAIAPLSGEYRLEIRPIKRTSAVGTFTVRLQELRIATSGDRRRVSTYKTFGRAEKLLLQSSPRSLAHALRLYFLVLRVLETLNDAKGVAAVFDRIGETYFELGQQEETIKYNSEAIPLLEAAGDRGVEAYAFYRIGVAFSKLGNKAKAVEYLEEARFRMLAAGDTAGEASALYSLGEVYSRSEHDKARQYFDQAMVSMDRSGDLGREAELLSGIGEVYARWGDLLRAREYFNRALVRYQAVNFHSSEEESLNSIASTYSNLGDNQQALALLKTALQSAQRWHDDDAEAAILLNFASLYGSLSDNDSTRSYLQKAISIASLAGSRATEADALTAMSEIYRIKNPTLAMRYLQRAQLQRKQLQDPEGDADLIDHMAQLYVTRGEYAKALEQFTDALHRRTKIEDITGQIDTLNNMGETYLYIKDYEKAAVVFGQVLHLTTTFYRDGRIEALIGLGSAERRLGQLQPARIHLEEALSFVEELRAGAPTRRSRLSYFSSVHSYYELYIAILMDLAREYPESGYENKALEAGERARARTLLDILTKARSSLANGSIRSTIEEQQVSAQIRRQVMLLRTADPVSNTLPLRRELDELIRQKLRLELDVNDKNNDIGQSAVLDIKELHSLLDDRTILLEYFVGDEHSYLWVVSHTSTREFELTGRLEIEKRVRDLLQLLNARNSRRAGENDIQREMRVARADGKVPQVTRTLTEMVLAPVLPMLGQNRLIIVSDGPLQYIPFAALPESTVHSTPLIQDHEIVMLPSFATLKWLRAELFGHKPASKTLAVFADPVVTAHDPRLTNVSLQQGDGAPEHRCGENVDAGRLAYTQREAALILHLIGPEQRMEAIGFDATLATASSPELNRYRIVHFATHGILDAACPESSRLLLSMFDSRGHSQDGALTLSKIYNLKWKADLVVLSACQTAVGQEIVGEGLVGITRAFMQAGVPRVVASLWQINGDAPAELMKHFYEGMLIRKLTPAAALRSAQLLFVQQKMDKRWSSPYYWAAFVVQGDWE